MKCISSLMVLTVILAIAALDSNAQSLSRVQDVKATPAFGVFILKRAALNAELVAQQAMFTSQHQDVQRTRYEIGLLNNEIERILVNSGSQISNLSTVYGDVVLRKIELQVEEHQLRCQVTATHPDLRKKRIEIAALQQEIDDLLR